MNARVRKNARSRNLTPLKIYVIIGLDHTSFRVIDDAGEPVLVLRTEFDEVRGDVPPEWSWYRYASGEFYAGPPELSAPGFYEDYFDGKPEARRIFADFISRSQDGLSS